MSSIVQPFEFHPVCIKNGFDRISRTSKKRRPRPPLHKSSVVQTGPSAWKMQAGPGPTVQTESHRYGLRLWLLSSKTPASETSSSPVHDRPEKARFSLSLLFWFQVFSPSFVLFAIYSSPRHFCYSQYNSKPAHRFIWSRNLWFLCSGYYRFVMRLSVLC